MTLSIWNNLIRLQLLQMLQTERKKDIKIVERISQKVCLHKFVNIGLPEHSQKKKWAICHRILCQLKEI